MERGPNLNQSEIHAQVLRVTQAKSGKNHSQFFTKHFTYPIEHIRLTIHIL